MSDPAVPPPISDAELLGRYAREAIEMRRFRMAAALTSLAQRAADFEARAARIEHDERARLVPIIGATRDEQPAARVAGMPLHEQDATNPLHPVGRRTPTDAFHMREDGRLAVIPVIGSSERSGSLAAAEGPALDETVVASAGSHAPNACAAQLPDGVCGALIGWSDGFSSVARKGWYHLDHTQTDHNHAAVPTLAAIDALDGRRPDVTRTDLRIADWVAGTE